MEKLIKKSTCYPLWESQNEVRDLNIASKNGLQLVKGKAFSWILEEDKSVRYTYQIDFYPKAKEDSRYKETFAEMGWEYISSTFNGWHYFRKPYEEGDQLETGEVVESKRIYTDKESYNEMEKRWQNLGRLLCIVCFLFGINYAALSSKETAFLGFSFSFLFFGLFIFTSIQNYKKKSENENYVPKFQIPFKIALPVYFILLILSFVVGFIK